jgi:peptide/nickel transport system substrate-binding protein
MERRHGTPKTRWVVVAILSVLAVFAAACGSSGDDEPEGAEDTTAPDVTVASGADVTPGGKIVYGLEAETSGWDPTTDRWAISGNMVAFAIYDPLSAYDADQQIQPYLAESFTPNEDFTSWVIKVRPNIKFHNGEDLDGAAVQLALDGIRASALAGGALRNVASTELVPDDPLAVQVNMTLPWASFPATLTGQAGVVPAPAQLNATDDSKSRRPIGTGPFVYSDWVPDNRFVGSRNDSYWMTDPTGNALPYLDEVEFRPIVDVQTRASSLLTGDINMMQTSDTLTINDLREEAATGAIQAVEDRGENEETFVMFNTQAPPFDNVTARRAVAYATNYEAYRTTFEIDEDRAADSAFAKDSEYYSDPDFPTYDPAMATQLVQQYEEETGQPLEFELGTTPVPSNQQAATLLSENYNAVGMSVTVSAIEQGQFITDAVTGNYQANLWRQFGANDPDADYLWWHKSNVVDGISLNIARFANDEVSAALDAARATPDPAVRAEQYKIVQDVWADQVPYVWLNTATWIIAAQNDVRNLGNVALPNPTTNVADIPSLPFQSGSHRMTMTWVER